MTETMESGASATRFGLGRNVLISLSFTGVMLALSMISSIVVARVGGPEARGLYSFAQSLYGPITPIATLGLGFATTYYLGAGHRAKELLGLNFAAAGGVFILGVAIGGGLLLAEGGLPQSTLGLVVLALCAGLWSLVFNNHASGYFLGQERIAADNLVRVSTLAVFILMTLVLLPMHRDGVLVALVLSHWLPTTVLAAIQWREVGLPKWPKRALRKLYVTYGIRASAGRTGDFLLLRIDTILLAFLVDLPALGLYAIADQLANVMTLGSTVIGRMMFAQSAQDPDGEESRRKLGILIRLLLPITIAITILALSSFWFLIPLLYSDAFTASYSAFVLISPVITFRAVTAQFAMYLTGQDEQRPVILASIWGLWRKPHS